MWHMGHVTRAIAAPGPPWDRIVALALGLNLAANSKSLNCCSVRLEVSCCHPGLRLPGTKKEARPVAWWAQGCPFPLMKMGRFCAVGGPSLVPTRHFGSCPPTLLVVGENCSHHQKMWRKLRTVWHCSGKLAPGWKPPRLAPLETRTELSSELPRSWHHVHRMGDHGDMIFCRPRLQLSSALCDQLRQLSHRGFSHLTWPLADPSDGWPSTGQDLPCTSGRNLLEGVSCRVPRLLSDPPPQLCNLLAELHELLCPLWRWTISRKLRNLCHGLPTLCGCSKEILIDLFAKSLDECFALCDPLHVQLLLLLGEPQRLRGLCNLVVGTLT